MREYKLDMSKYNIDDQPIMWTDAEYREAFQSLYFEYHKLKRERDTLEVENEKLKQQLKEAREFFVDVKVENEKLKQQLKEAREFFVDVKVENEELKRKLKECNGE